MPSGQRGLPHPRGPGGGLRDRVEAAGGVDEVSVAEVGDEQMGNLHVLVATAPGGHLVGRFQTIPGQRGALVVRATSSGTTW